MSYSSEKSKIVESKKAKRLRITLAVLYFLQVVLTTFPFTWIVDDSGNVKEFTAFEMAIRPSGYETTQEVKLAVLFGIFVLFPVVCFFFCCLDKSFKKNFVSFACCIVCSCLITFGIGATVAMGAIVSLLLYVLILFLTTQSLLVGVSDNK